MGIVRRSWSSSADSTRFRGFDDLFQESFTSGQFMDCHRPRSSSEESFGFVSNFPPQLTPPVAAQVSVSSSTDTSGLSNFGFMDSTSPFHAHHQDCLNSSQLLPRSYGDDHPFYPAFPSGCCSSSYQEGYSSSDLPQVLSSALSFPEQPMDHQLLSLMGKPPLCVNYLTDVGSQEQPIHRRSRNLKELADKPLKSVKRDRLSCNNERPSKRVISAADPVSSSSCCTSTGTKKGPALNTNLKPRARQGTASDPQSIAARQRRERVSERLKILQNLVPNGSKVDLVTMLEKAINYVKFMQLQIQVLTADEHWPLKPKLDNGNRLQTHDEQPAT